MSQTVQPQTQVPQPNHPEQTSSQKQLGAPTIAIRKSCNPDGIGLSHYVLMDRKIAK